MIKAIGIAHGNVLNVMIPPTHSAVEEYLGTTFWCTRRLRNGRHGDVLFYCEAQYAEKVQFVFGGVGYSGNGLIAHYDMYGDLESTKLTLKEVKERVTFT